MKLSDIKGDRTLEVIAEIIDPIANIVEDDTASAMFRREKLPDGVTAKKFLLQRARKSLPVLLKDCTDLLTDETFSALFISAQSEKQSGSAPENTEAPEQ